MKHFILFLLVIFINSTYSQSYYGCQSYYYTYYSNAECCYKIGYTSSNYRYYYTFCPDNTYCGSFCAMAIIYGSFGSCFCLCGLAFFIGFCVLVYKLFNNKNSYKTQPVQTELVLAQHGATPTTVRSVLQYSPVTMKQNLQQDTLPPQIPGYTYNPTPSNTGGATSYPLLMDTSVNLPLNLEFDQAPQVVAHGDTQLVT